MQYQHYIKHNISTDVVVGVVGALCAIVIAIRAHQNCTWIVRKGRGGALRRVCNKCTSFAIYALRARARGCVYACVCVLYKFSVLYLFSAKFWLLREMAVP